MPKCLVPSCRSKFSMCKERRKLSFFSIPNGLKNPRKWKTAEKWLNFCGLDIDTFQFGAQHKIICEKHFSPEDVELMDMKIFPHGFRGHLPKRVKFGAVPQIYDVSDIPDPPTPEMVPVKEEVETEDNPMEEAVEDERSRYVNDFIPEPLDKPLSEERRSAADLARWPPSLNVEVQDLNEILTCGICGGYFYNASTITECLHTFCKGCIVNHFGTSLTCPSCGIEVHPMDPLVNVRPDPILQDIVYKIFPQRQLQDQADQAEFYVSRGMNPPEHQMDKTNKQVPEVEMISLRLEYAGTTPSLLPHQRLQKKFLRIPNNVTVGQIVKFLRLKMQLPVGSQAAMFVNCFMLNEALSIHRIQEIFGSQIQEEYSDIMLLQYGIIPKADYFDKGLLVSTKYL